jgi:MPBQ/MSBQ methyltransferase
MRTVQHKKEAYWFYRFLSIFYDNYVNPFFWTERMRDQSLELAKLDRRDLLTIDVGSGTGFTTRGIVQKVNPSNIFCLDQSPHQMAKAKEKIDLQSCTFQLGDAEDIPFPVDHFDRYVSAGSIEYWPDPRRGITEAYRVLKPGGIALMIGPLRPENLLGRFLADTWMLFPREEEYLKWFEAAGFVDLQKRYVKPGWIAREKYGIALAGRKPQAGESPAPFSSKKFEWRDEPMTLSRLLLFVPRLLIGSLAGFFFIPLAMFGYFRRFIHRLLGRIPAEEPEPEKLTPEQKLGLIMIGFILIFLIWWISGV